MDDAEIDRRNMAPAQELVHLLVQVRRHVHLELEYNATSVRGKSLVGIVMMLE